MAILRQDAIEFVRQLEGAVNEHDSARLVTMYADDAVTVSPMFPTIFGREAIRKSWDTIFALFPDWTVNVSDVLIDGDRIAFLGQASGTDRNGWFGQPATGERIDYRAIILLTVADGKIIRDERIYDVSGLLKGLEKARIDKELGMAAEVQRRLSPRTQYVNTFCEAAAQSLPCRAIGGDFLELTPVPSGELAIALGDVAGKGPASALLAAMIQGMLSMEVEAGRSPAAILSRINRALFRKGLESRFATLVYGVLSGNGRLVYSNAGHNAPILLTRDGIGRLSTGGPVLGAFSESTFEEQEVNLKEGDTIIMFSDGLAEALNAEGEEFGEGRLIQCVSQSRVEPPERVLQKLFSSVQDFSRGTTQNDDLSVSVIRFRGTQS
jgi:ketosteroid isomerase-like protein